jgi:hypothetical protein
MSNHQMSSSEFRVRYAAIDYAVDVTVNGRVIGRWVPAVVTVPEDRPVVTTMTNEPLRGAAATAAYKKLRK